MPRKGLLRFILACLPWMVLPALSFFGFPLWGAAGGLTIIVLLFFLMPSGRRWGILQAFSLLFFVVACAAVIMLGEDIDTRIPNLLAGGFACLSIMAGYGAIEGVFFPAQYVYLDYPESMRESPILRQMLWVLTIAWDGVFVAGLVVNLVCMLALRGDTSTDTAAIASAALIAAGVVATPFIVIMVPKRLESGLVEKGPLSIKWEPPAIETGRPLRKNEYDVAVVGSGIGGLSCASLLSQAGMKVIVAEKARLVGGYCQTYDWEGFPLNSGPTVLLGGGEGGVLGALIHRLGLENEVPMRRMHWGVADGKIALRLGMGIDEDLAKIEGKFPSSRDGLRRLLGDLRRFRGELLDRPDPLTSPLPCDLQEYHEQFIRHPISALWQNLSFQAMMDEYLPDEQLGDLLLRTSSLLGGDPRRFPAYEGARLLVALLLDGIHYPANHLSHLSQKLAGVVTGAGGEVLTSCAVEEVLIQGEGVRGRPIGLRLADGSQVRSNVVVLNMDPRRAMTGMLQPSNLGFEFVREMEKLKVSPSAFVLHLVFQENLRMPERVFLFLPKARRVRTGDTYLEVTAITLTKEACTDPDRPGCVLLARINVPSKCYHAFENEAQGAEMGAELTYLVKEEIASILPAVKKAVREFVTLPSHFTRLTANGQGAAFGFASTLDQWYYRRPGPRMPLANLYLVGAWSRFGGGVEGAVLSGVIAARELCGEHPYGGATGTGAAVKAAGAETPMEPKRDGGKKRGLRRGRKEEEEEEEEEAAEGDDVEG
ncbi:MAG: NAD(P)/FAD-dependent oxidoreductase [Actinomycetota bacterium]